MIETRTQDANPDVAVADTIAGTTEQQDISTVLCVDDEPNILLALERVLRRKGLRVVTANGGEQALAVLERERVDVLLSDMRMPGMDGAQLLAKARERWPDTVRLLLTGHADHADTIRAINAGKVFGYMAKPWDADALRMTIDRAAEMARMSREKVRLEALTRAQNDALHALTEYLEIRVEERTAELQQAQTRIKRNYMNSIKVFSNLIELRGGQLIGHGRRVAELARQIANAMGCADELAQRVFVAGLLHDIGLIGLPDAALARPVAHLDPEHQSLFKRHATLGEQSLLSLDDMQPVATLIRGHHERFDGKGFPDGLAGDRIELGARILAVADTYDEMISGAFGTTGLPLDDVLTLMQRGSSTRFDPDVLDAMTRVVKPPRDSTKPMRPVIVGWTTLEPGMELAADLRSREGALLLSSDHVLTIEMIERVRTYARREATGLELQIKPRARGAGHATSAESQAT